MRAILAADTAVLVDLSAALAAGFDPEIDTALERARADASATQIEEAILQSYLFLGFPAALEGMRRWRVIADEPRAEADHAVEGDLGEWHRRGTELCRRVYGANYEKLRRSVARLHPALDRWMVIEGYGKVLTRPGLDPKVRELCIVGLLTAARREVQLHSHLRGALNVGAGSGAVEAAIRIGLRHVEAPEWTERVEQLWWSVRERWVRQGSTDR